MWYSPGEGPRLSRDSVCFEEQISQVRRNLIAFIETLLQGRNVLTFNIVRVFRKSGRRKIIHRNVTQGIAILHTNSPLTRRPGVWFDMFEVAR